MAVGLLARVPTRVEIDSGSASITTNGTVTFSGVTSVSLVGVFSSSYQFYMMTATCTIDTTSAATLFARLLSGSTQDQTVNYYYEDCLVSGSTTTPGRTSASQIAIGPMQIAKPNNTTVFITNPNNSNAATGFRSTGSAADFVGTDQGGSYVVNAAFDGIVVTAISSLQKISGTVTVYAFNQ